MEGQIEVRFNRDTAYAFMAELSTRWPSTFTACGYSIKPHTVSDEFGDEWIVDVERRVDDRTVLQYRIRDAATPHHAVYLAVDAMNNAFALGQKHGAATLVDAVTHNVENFLKRLQ
jgi:hypothetical protein